MAGQDVGDDGPANCGENSSVKLSVKCASLGDMPIVRLLLAGLIALFAMVAVLFTAAVVFLTGLLGWVAQLFRPKGSRPAAGTARPVNPGMGRRGPAGAGEVIDIEATRVPEKPAERLP
ncbi:MAG: hypothetical protein QG602_4141 [Verrucomicrobiota bacterium]|nr:hypothetical protein [Verrucomicrobiota bacterium]